MSQIPPENQPQQPQQPYPEQYPQQQPQYPPQQYQQQPYPPQYAPIPPKKNNCLLYGIIGAVALLVICGVIAVATGAIGTKVASSLQTLATQVANFTPVAGTTPLATVAPVAKAPSYQDIVAQKSALTAAQLTPYLEGLKGARIDNWTGTTLDVAPKIFSSDVYQIQVDLTGPADNPLKNIQAYVDITKDQAQSIAKGKAVTFSGNIDHIDCTFICTVEVKDATYTLK